MTLKNQSILKKINKEGFLVARLYSNSVIEIVWDTSIETIEVFHLTKMKEAVYELGGGRKMPLLFAVHDFLQLSKEAGKYAVSKDGIMYTLANAVIIDNLAKKIIFNFFMKIHKPVVPTKGFSNKDEAISWLEKF